MESIEIVKIAANALNEKKATALSALEVGSMTVLSDYILIATAASSTHVRALADEVEEKLSAAGVLPHHIEGRATGWILLDYNRVIIHVQSRELREFYGLDHIWSDGVPVDLGKILVSVQEES